MNSWDDDTRCKPTWNKLVQYSHSSIHQAHAEQTTVVICRQVPHGQCRNSLSNKQLIQNLSTNYARRQFVSRHCCAGSCSKPSTAAVSMTTTIQFIPHLRRWAVYYFKKTSSFNDVFIQPPKEIPIISNNRALHSDTCDVKIKKRWESKEERQAGFVIQIHFLQMSVYCSSSNFFKAEPGTVLWPNN